MPTIYFSFAHMNKDWVVHKLKLVTHTIILLLWNLDNITYLHCYYECYRLFCLFIINQKYLLLDTNIIIFLLVFYYHCFIQLNLQSPHHYCALKRGEHGGILQCMVDVQKSCPWPKSFNFLLPVLTVFKNIQTSFHFDNPESFPILFGLGNDYLASSNTCTQQYLLYVIICVHLYPISYRYALINITLRII